MTITIATIVDGIRLERCAPTVSIGRHQVMAREARLSHCQDTGIATLRRPTAGGALYLDPGIQCVSLSVPTTALGATLAARLEAAAALITDVLTRLGVVTKFKPPNDLETVERQKIASVFLGEEGPRTRVFATIIAELDLKSAMQALLVPTEKLTVTGLEHARERMTSLADLLGRIVDQREIAEAVSQAAAARFGSQDFSCGAASNVPDIAWRFSPASFETKDKTPGATLRLLLDVGGDGVITAAQFATDAHLLPEDALCGLAAALQGSKLNEAETAAANFLATGLRDAAGLSADNIVRLVARAAAKWQMQREVGLSPEQTSGLMLAGGATDVDNALANASVMLVPYCAKPNWCKWRHTIDCVECGECEVGDAYAMARSRNLEVVTITNFEHLADTLTRMKAADVESYVGMCCGEFFLKRHHAFRDSGMEAVLLDIEGATCYELKEEHLAYAGAFKAEARLDLDALQKVMTKVPARPEAAKPCLSGLARRPGEKRCSACSKSATPP